MQEFRIKIISFFCFLFSNSFFYSQTNLVLNPSFETYTACPNNPGEIAFAAGWSSHSYSPDYLNFCGGPGLSIPSNAFGYQYPSSGNAYSGFLNYMSKALFPSSNGLREYIGGTLSSTLAIGIKYYVSFKVVLALEPSSPSNCASSKMGVRFSKNPFSSGSPAPSNNAKVYSNSIITDTLNWNRVFGSFVADSAYKYLTIGNFFNNNNTDTLIMTIPSNTYCSSYYYLDDVCVSTDSSFTANFSVGIPESFKQNLFIYPNPVFTFFNLDIANSTSPIQLTLYNKIGEEILFKEINSSHNVIDLPDVPPGILLLKIYYKEQYFYYKLLKQ